MRTWEHGGRLLGRCVGLPFYLGLAAAAALALYQQRLARTREPGACFRAFLNNNWLGAAVFAGIALNYALA
jgi:4-hydroxybenzoate polyprenyltransferase